MKSDFDRGFTDNIHVSQVSTKLGAELSRAEAIALGPAAETDLAERRSLNATLDQNAVPAVDAGLVELQALHAQDGPAERARAARLAEGWSQFVALRDTGSLGSQLSAARVVAASDRLSRQISGSAGS